MNALSFSAGKDFEVVTVSFSPSETHKLAAAKKRRYIERYGREGAANGWHFLTGDEPSIRRLAQAAGFRYVYNPHSKLYAHAAGIVLATPGGRIARYFYGISYPARDLRLGLIEASEGKIGSPIDQMMLFCYVYDSSSGRYTFAIMSAVRLMAIATFMALVMYILLIVRRPPARGKHPDAHRLGRPLDRSFSLKNEDSIMWDFPLFPQQASTISSKVDGVFFYTAPP